MVVMEASPARRSLARLPWVVRSEGLPARPAEARQKRERRERGAVVVEFAFVLPILVALVFGIISYGYMLSYRQGLSQAASEAARAAAMVPSGMSTTEKTARATSALANALGNYGVTCTGGVLKRQGVTNGSCSIQVNTACPADATRRCAVVTLSHAYRDHPIIQSFPGLGITLPRNLNYTSAVEVN